jgi:hypothetical protein
VELGYIENRWQNSGFFIVPSLFRFQRSKIGAFHGQSVESFDVVNGGNE